MLNLRASIRVIPRSVYDKLHPGELKKIDLIIQLDNRSNAYPDGVLEDVLVEVNELIFPNDFYILDMGTAFRDVPIFLGRPFLKTSRIKIVVHSGTLTMEFDGEIIKFNIFDAMKFPIDVNYLCALDVIDELSQDVYELSHEDELLTTLTQGLDQFVFHNVSYHVNGELVGNMDSLLQLHVTNRPWKLEMPKSQTKMLPSRIAPPSLN